MALANVLMNHKNALKEINASQDGSPLTKYFTDHGRGMVRINTCEVDSDATIGDKVNCILVGVIDQLGVGAIGCNEACDQIAYAIEQLGRAQHAVSAFAHQRRIESEGRRPIAT